ncbi:FkbM family methyltransferase [Pontimonas sp.]|nr:FkbM family methyltransferase [Pontimonas sp.]
MIHGGTLKAHVSHLAASVIILARRNLPITRSRALSKVFGNRSFGLGGIDQELIKKMDLRNGYYVEIGANNGVAQSNTLALELYYGWRGILIEPVRTTYEELLLNRSKRRNQLIRAACVSFQFVGQSLQIARSNLMSSAIGLESDIVDPIQHAKSGLRFLNTMEATVAIEIEEVPAVTMSSILYSAKAPKRIQLLSLDTEGSEIEVLKGIDFAAFRFEWILTECRDIEKMKAYLTPLGYSLVGKLSVHDYLFRDTTQEL